MLHLLRLDSDREAALRGDVPLGVEFDTGGVASPPSISSGIFCRAAAAQPIFEPEFFIWPSDGPIEEVMRRKMPYMVADFRERGHKCDSVSYLLNMIHLGCMGENGEDRCGMAMVLGCNKGRYDYWFRLSKRGAIWGILLLPKDKN